MTGCHRIDEAAMRRWEWRMLRDLECSQTDIMPFGHKPDKHNVDEVL